MKWLMQLANLSDVPIEHKGLWNELQIPNSLVKPLPRVPRLSDQTVHRFTRGPYTLTKATFRVALLVSPFVKPETSVSSQLKWKNCDEKICGRIN